MRISEKVIVIDIIKKNIETKVNIVSKKNSLHYAVGICEVFLKEVNLTKFFDMFINFWYLFFILEKDLIYRTCSFFIYN